MPKFPAPGKFGPRFKPDVSRKQIQILTCFGHSNIHITIVHLQENKSYRDRKQSFFISVIA